MKKRIVIKSASCLDMINAINSKIHELDPNYIEGSQNIHASDDGMYSDADMAAIDRSGSDKEYAIAAISYYYGISVAEAKETYKTISNDELEDAIEWYNSRGLPTKDRLARFEARKKNVSASNCNSYDTCGCQDNVQGTGDCSGCDQDYVQGSDLIIDDNYIDEVMQSVADETASFDAPAVCSWRIEGRKIVFVLTGIEEDFVDEYTCPIIDLTGNVDTDIDYILSAINGR